MNRFTSLSVTAAALLGLLCAGSGCNLDPNYAKQQYLNSGNKYFDRGRFKEALIMYRKAVAKDPKFGPAYYRLALTYEKLGQGANSVNPLRRSTELLPPGSPEWNDAALKLSEDLLQAAIGMDVPGRNQPLLDEVHRLEQAFQKSAPNSFESYRLEGDLKRAAAAQLVAVHQTDGVKQDLEDAIGFLRKSLTVRPNDVPASVDLARTLTEHGDLPEAEQIYRGLLDRDPSLTNVYTELYRLYSVENQPAKAEETLQRAIAKNPKVFSFQTLLAAHYFTQKNQPEMKRVLDHLESQYHEFPDAFLTAGDFYARIGNLDEATREYQQGISKDPTRKADYEKRVVEVLLRQGKKNDAFAKNEQLLKEFPKDSEARGLKANFLLEKGDVSDAFSELQAVVAATPDNAVAQYDLGRAYLARGEVAQAVQHYQQAAKLRPDFLRPRLGLTEISLQQGDYQGALNAALEIEKMAPGNPGGRLLEGVALMHLGKLKEARSILEEITTKYPQLADAQFQLGVLGMTEKNYPAAQEAFHKSYVDRPGDMQGFAGEIETWFARNQPAKAVAVAQQEVDSHPGRTDLLRELANAKAKAGEADSALADYNTLLKRPSLTAAETAQIESAIGQIQYRKAEYPAALESFTKARQAQPNNLVLLNTLAQLYDRLGRKKEAVDAYRTVLSIDPNNAGALNNLAFVMASSGADLDEALTFANRAKQRLPDAAEVNDTIGYIYIQKKLPDQAIDVFRDLTAKAPNNPTFHYHFCMALSEKGDKAGAAKECNAALAKNPAKDEEASVRQLLAKL